MPGSTQAFSYTPFDLPSSITTGGTQTLFEYTADEERVVRRDPATTRYSVGRLYERLVGATSADTQEQRFRIYAGSRQIAEIVRTATGDRTVYLHADPIGTIDTLSDDQKRSYHQSFEPFGSPLDTPASAVTRAGFTGHLHDADLGLVDMKGRMYDPLASRFMSPDPIFQAPLMSQGLNRYSYVFNDPVNFVDPSGFDAWSDMVESPFAQATAAMAIGAIGGGLGVGGLGINIGSDLIFGLPGQGSAARQFSGVPSSAAPSSSAVARESVHAAGQHKGGVGPAVPQRTGGGGESTDWLEDAVREYKRADRESMTADRYIGLGTTPGHVNIAVDTWIQRSDGNYEKVGQVTYDFAPASFYDFVKGLFGGGKGQITETPGLWSIAPKTIPSSPQQDEAMLQNLRAQAKNPPKWHATAFNCWWWSILNIQHSDLLVNWQW